MVAQVLHVFTSRQYKLQKQTHAMPKAGCAITMAEKMHVKQASQNRRSSLVPKGHAKDHSNPTPHIVDYLKSSSAVRMLLPMFVV